MSRSRKKNPYIGNCGNRSEKRDKQIANKSYRRAINMALSNGDEDLPVMRELSNVWTFSKDGKQRLSEDNRGKWMRK